MFSEEGGYLKDQLRKDSEEGEYLHERARIRDRRDSDFASLVLYLNNRDSLQGNYPLILNTKANVISTGLKMFASEVETPENDVNSSVPVADTSLQERLNQSVGSVKAGMIRPERVDAFKQELDYYGRYGVRGPLLDKFQEFMIHCWALRKRRLKANEIFLLRVGLPQRHELEWLPINSTQ